MPTAPLDNQKITDPAAYSASINIYSLLYSAYFFLLFYFFLFNQNVLFDLQIFFFLSSKDCLKNSHRHV